MKIATLVVSLFLGATCFAQPSKGKLSVGIEQDVLPYLTGLFCRCLAGKDHWRGRVLTACVTKPDFIQKKGFTNNVQAYALLADYFLKKNRDG